MDTEIIEAIGAILLIIFIAVSLMTLMVLATAKIIATTIFSPA